MKGFLHTVTYFLTNHPTGPGKEGVIHRERGFAMRDIAKMVFVLLGVGTLLLSGCTSLGPRTISRDRFDYTAAISDSWKSQMLLNMVKMRYGDAPVFLDVGTLINQYAVEGLVDAGASWISDPYSSSQVIGAGAKYANRPTITYTPLKGGQFARNLMTPIPPASILNLAQAGYPVDLVFRLCVHSVNGVQNRYGGTARPLVADPEFYPLLERMRRIQDSGAIGLRVQKVDEKDTFVIVFKSKVDGATEADIAEVRKVLGLDPHARAFKVVYGAIAADDKEIAILSRSMLQIIIDLGSYIAVPESHVAEKRTPANFKDEPVNGVPLAPLIRVTNSPQKPTDAFVSIRYADYWFWIDDKDFPSKRIFSFLMFIFTLTETGVEEKAPPVVLPLG